MTIFEEKRFGLYEGDARQKLLSIDNAQGLSDEFRVYFSFVEGWTDHGLPHENEKASKVMDAPDESSKHRPYWLSFLPDRCRMSGIRTSEFLRAEPQFEVLDPETVTLEQRARRKGMLVEMFGWRPIPVIDLFSTRNHPQLPEAGELLELLLEGNWKLLILRRSGEAERDLPVWLSDPDPGINEPLSRWWLDAILPVPVEIEARLRDIFSLIHIPDAGAGGGDGTVPITPDPNNDEDGLLYVDEQVMERKLKAHQAIANMPEARSPEQRTAQNQNIKIGDSE